MFTDKFLFIFTGVFFQPPKGLPACVYENGNEITGFNTESGPGCRVFFFSFGGLSFIRHSYFLSPMMGFIRFVSFHRCQLERGRRDLRGSRFVLFFFSSDRFSCICAKPPPYFYTIFFTSLIFIRQSIWLTSMRITCHVFWIMATFMSSINLGWSFSFFTLPARARHSSWLGLHKCIGHIKICLSI